MSLPGPLAPVDAWTRARDRYTEDLSDQERELYKKATIENIFYDASTAEKTHRATSSTRKFATQRLGPLIEAIAEYGKALDVYANTSPLILCPLWGSIRVVLHIAKEYGEYFDKIVEMFARIGDILPRLRDYEKLFGSHERLAQAISTLYVDVLEFCANVKSLFRAHRRPSMVNILVFSRSTWKPFKSHFDQTLAKIREHRKNVEAEANISHMLEAKHARELEIAARLEAEAQKREHERLRILAMLSTTNYEQKQRKLHNLRHRGTCDWLFKTSKFTEWRASASSTCLHCYAGSGKSILASAVVEYLRSDIARGNHRVAFHYCDYTDNLTLTPRGIFGSLSQQLLGASQLSDDVAAVIKKGFEDGTYSPTVQEIQHLLCRSLEPCPSVLLIIDGLDECDQACRGVVLSIVDWLMTLNSCTVRLLVSSQGDIQILNALERYPKIQLSPTVLNHDIQSYVAHATRTLIEEGQLLIQGREIEHDIVTELTSRANGMFLWVAFQFQDICEATSDYMIRQTLKDLPQGLFETYSRKLAKIVKRRKLSLVRRIFSWVAVAVRPLLLEELQEAIAFDSTDILWDCEKLPHPSVVMGSCENLVILDEDGQVSFAHHTVQSFLESLNSNALYSEFYLDIAAANILAATFCVSYLSFDDFEAQVVSREQPIKHIQATTGLSTGGFRFVTGALGLSDRWFTLPYRLLGGKPYHAPCPIEISWKTTPQPRTHQSLGDKYRMLDYAIENWLVHTKDLHTALYVDETTVTRFRKLALERVMVFDHTKWAAVSSPKALHSEELPYDAICRWATDNSHLPILGLLQPPPWGPGVHHYWWVQSQNGEDPFRGPCLKGHHDLLKFMLRSPDTVCHEAEKNMQELLTPHHLVWCASANGHYDIVETIIAKGVSPNTTSPRPYYVSDDHNLSKASALEIAVRKGHVEVIRRLISHGAKVNAPDPNLKTPLHYANNDRIVTLLLQGGAHIESKSRTGERPLHSTAAAGMESAVSKLIAAGASVNAADCLGRIPLHHASDLVTAARLLEFHPSTIGATDTNYETPLLLAVRKGYTALVTYYCNFGASTQSVNASGETALHLAAKLGHLAVVQELLVRHAVELQSRDHDGITPLHHALQWWQRGYRDFVLLFLERGVDIAEFWRLAWLPCEKYPYEVVINGLLELHLPIDHEAENGMSALHHAAEKGSILAISKLIEKHANIDKANNHGCTPLMCGISRGQLPAVRTLLEAGASVDLQDYHGRTALFIAASLDETKIAYLLRAYGADPTIAGRAPEDEGEAQAPLKTPLQVLKTRRWADLDLVAYLEAQTWNKAKNRALEGSTP